MTEKVFTASIWDVKHQNKQSNILKVEYLLEAEKNTVQSLSNTTLYVWDLDITWSCCDTKILLPWHHACDALRSPTGKGLTSWLSFVMSNCYIVTFPLVSWVRCGA